MTRVRRRTTRDRLGPNEWAEWRAQQPSRTPWKVRGEMYRLADQGDEYAARWLLEESRRARAEQ